MSDGALRTPWRVLLFVILFVAVFWLEALLVPMGVLDAAGDRISATLVAQAGLMLLAALVAAWVMLRWVDRRPARSLGFPPTWAGARELAVGLAVGALALAGVIAVMTLLGWFRYGPGAGSLGGWAASMALTLAGLAVPAAAEEALIRGYPFRALLEGHGPVVAVVATSIVFAWLHGSNPGVGALGFVNLFLAGALLAVAVLRTGTLWLATGVHLGWNWVMAGPLELPVSGLDGPDVPLYDAAVTGPAWLTGGAFGPEGGLVGTLGVLVALGLVVRVTRPGGLLGVEDRR